MPITKSATISGGQHLAEIRLITQYDNAAGNAKLDSRHTLYTHETTSFAKICSSLRSNFQPASARRSRTKVAQLTHASATKQWAYSSGRAARDVMLRSSRSNQTICPGGGE